MTSTLRTTRRVRVQRHSLAGLIAGALVAACTVGTSPFAGAMVTKAEIKAAEQKAERAEDAAADAAKALKKDRSALAKANKNVAELESDLAELNQKFAAADKDRKDKLAPSIRDLQEELRQAVSDRSSRQTNLARAERQVESLKAEAVQAEKDSEALEARQKTELAEWKQRQAEEKAQAAQAAAQPAPVVAAPVPVVETVPAELQNDVAQAQAKKSQADAVVQQRTEDLEKAKDADARKKAEAALRDAEKFAGKQEKQYQKAVAELQEEQVVPRHHQRQELVSEPAPWATPAEPQGPAVMRPGETLTTPEAQAAQIAPAGQKLQFDVPMIAGDKDIVADLAVWQEWAAYITFNPVTAEEINEFHGKLTKALQEKGYVFAKVTFPTRIWAYGIFLAKVDCGPLGTITVTGNRNYSADQIIRALADQPGASFNYARVHGDLFDLNAKPDLNINTQLKPVMQDGRRVINAELEVEDNLPVHGSIELSNTGSEVTDDWRIRTTLQHVNLTKHDDVLSLDWLTSPDISTVNAWSGAYFLPVDDLRSINVYAGYSNSNIDDVLPQLDIRGRGYYVGGQLTKTLTETTDYRTQLSGSWLYQYWESEQDITGVNWDDRRLRLSMPSVTYGYANRVFDDLGGRNFASASVLASFAGTLGTSDSEEFIGQGGRGVGADGDFVIGRFQLARLQRFFRGEEAPGKWSLFMKMDGQVASNALPTPVRRSVGGANSVRGYEESEIAGDNAVVATVELRTPLFQNFIPGLKKDDEFLEMNPEAWQRHRLQLVAFADMGWIGNKEALPGEMDSEVLASAGLGMRLGLTKYSQMRLDYGYPLQQTTAATPSNGRIHMSLQLQF